MMNKRLRSMIDEIFSEMKMTAENLALRDELMANAQSRFDDAIAQGKTEEEAFAEVAASLEDVGNLLGEMNGADDHEEPEETEEAEAAEDADEAPAQDAQSDLSDALNKAFTALESWGQSLMPQAKKFARQVDDATGGMLRDIGRAVNKGMQDAQKAAGDVLDKYQQENAEESDAEYDAASTQQEDTPLYGADGELDEEAFARTVEQVTREAENLAGEAEAPVNELRFPAVGLRNIDVKLDADDVFIEPTSGDELIVRWTAKDDDSVPEVTMHSHALCIRRKNPDVFKTFFSVFSKDGGQITLLVPHGYAADYTLSTTSGDVRLGGVDVDSVRISTTSGDVRLEPDTRVRARDICAETISGSVTISAMAVDISAKSVSGDVFISCDAASIKGDVVSGTLHVEGAFDSVDADAVSGSMKLICTVPPTGKIKADALSGSIMLLLPGTIRGFAVSFDSMSGHMTNEFGPDRFGTCALPIEVGTVSGSLTIARL